jgi:hypothetical protein
MATRTLPQSRRPERPLHKYHRDSESGADGRDDAYEADDSVPTYDNTVKAVDSLGKNEYQETKMSGRESPRPGT